MIKIDPKFRFADLFCGAGGFTTGAEQSGYARGALAINHWRPAVYSHETNHPHVRHVCASIDHVDPRDFANDGINLLLASPECIYHSVARGGRPVEDQRRATAWCVPRWLEALKPKWAIVENVREFVDWGPLGNDNRPLKSKKGEIFRALVQAITALNYHVEWKLLNAADFGGATKRIRLFVVCRRGRSTKPIPWPETTHTKANWTPAWKIIDWSKPCPSIFHRKRPLAEKTLRRIEAGLRKFCKPEIVEPFLVKMRGTNNAAKPGNSIVVPSADEPLNTVLCENRQGVVTPFLTTYYGTGHPQTVDELISTLTTKHRHGLALVETMRELGIVDIGFRMLDVDELAAAQGFSRDYHLHGNKAEQVKQIGNAVHTAVARALVEAIGRDG